jgi:putative ABC transport system permease protein
VASLDPNQPVSSIQAIGVYCVMGCRVRWQLPEVAVRQALGAHRGDVVRHVLRQGLAVVLPGLCLGLLGSAALRRLLSSMLYHVEEVPANDLLMLAAVSVGLIGSSRAFWKIRFAK